MPHLARTGLTPNHITFLAMLAGLLAAACFSQGARAWMLAGAALLQLSFILDNCDGALARIKSMQSGFGKWFDFTADLAVDLALWTGLALGSLDAQPKSVVALVWGLACAGSVINFLRVVTEPAKRAAAEPLTSSRASGPLKAFDELSHDGDPTVLVWAMAALAGPFVFLCAGAFYIHFLWVGALCLKLL